MRAPSKVGPIGVRASHGAIVALICAAWIIAPLAAERSNLPPTLQGLFPVVRGAENTAGAHVSLSVFATDPDGDPITVTFTGPLESQTLEFNPTGFYAVTMLFPIGTSTLTVTATDSGGLSTRATASVTVLGALSSDTGTIVVGPPALLDGATQLQPNFSPAVDLTIDNAAGPGVTVLNIRTDIAQPPLPDGYQLGSPPYYYSLSTTVPGGGPYTFCVDTTGMSFANRDAVRMYHYEGAQWQDRTTAAASPRVCGRAATLGTFALVHPGVPSNAAVTIAGSGYTVGSIDGPGGDPRDDFIDGRPATETSLRLGLGGIALDLVNGLLYTTTFAQIRRVNLSTGILDTIAGDGVVGRFQIDADGTVGIPAQSNVVATTTHVTNPNQLALDNDGNLYMAEYCQVRRVDRVSDIITTVAGDGFCRHRGDGLPATQASLDGSYGLAFDAAGSLLIGEGSGRIRRVDANGIISTVAGNGTTVVSSGQSQQSGWPLGQRLALAPNGDLYIATSSNLILRLSAGSDGVITGAADESISVVNGCALTTCSVLPFGGDGGPVASATFGEIDAVAVEPNGDLLVADNTDERIRRISAGADQIVTGLDADEIVQTIAGYNPTYIVSGKPAGSGFFLQGENYALSSATFRMPDILLDPRGGFYYANSSVDEVRRVGAAPAQAPNTDLAVSISGPARAALNSGALFIVSLDNTGPNDASGVSITFSVPPALEILGLSTQQGSCFVPASGTPGPATCDLGTVVNGRHLQFALSTRAKASGPATATVDVASPTPDLVPANNHAAATVAVNHPPVVNAGGDRSFPATSAAGGTAHLAGSASDADGDALTFTWKDENGTTVATSATADLSLTAGTHTMTLIANDGLNTGQGSVDITIEPTSDVGIVAALANPAAGAHVGTPLTYRATLSNFGPFTAPDARMRFALSAGLQYVSAVPTAGHCDFGAGILVCDVINLGVGGAFSVDVSLTPAALGTLTAVFTASASDGDLNPANDSASVSVNPDIAIVETIHVTDTMTNPDVDIQEVVKVTDTLSDTFAPIVTPPPNLIVDATEAGGARGNVQFSIASKKLHDFLTGGTATDDTDPSPTRLTPLLADGTPATDDTLFPFGADTPVTFRFRDAAGNIGTATATISVLASIGGAINTANTPVRATDKTGAPTPVAASFGALVQPGLLTADILTSYRPLVDMVALTPVYDVVSTALVSVGTPIIVSIAGNFPPDAVMLHDNGAAWEDVTIACGTGQVCGSVFSLSPFVVAHRPDTTPPVVTAPASITIPATLSTGARAADSPALAAFLAGGTATDNVDPTATRLVSLVNGQPVTSTTVFPFGSTVVTFRFQDRAGNIGTATSSVTVVLGTPRIGVRVAASGTVSGTRKYVDLEFANTGDGNARNVYLDVVLLVPIKGGGNPTLASPALPLQVGSLDVGATRVVRLLLDVPSNVKQLSLTEGGHFQDVKGTFGAYLETQKIAW